MKIKRLTVVGLFLLASISNAAVGFDAPAAASKEVAASTTAAALPCPLLAILFHCRPMGLRAQG